MRIKITEPGWAGYTGEMGQTQFEDGISVEDVSPGIARMLGAIFRCECLETGVNPSASQSLADMKGKEESREREKKERKPKVAVLSDRKKEATVDFDLEPFNKEHLEKIADAEGIKGLRAIGDKVGASGKSIESLVEGILAVRSKQRSDKKQQTLELEDANTDESGG